MVGKFPVLWLLHKRHVQVGEIHALICVFSVCMSINPACYAEKTLTKDHTSKMQPARPFTHLSEPHPEWTKVAENHRAVEERMAKLYSLPIEEFRKVPYRPAPLSATAPRPGHDLVITEQEVEVRDGTKISLRIYEPVQHSKGHPLYFNIHGGGQSL